MANVIGQRYEIYNYQQIKNEIPRRGEKIIVKDTPDHGASAVTLIGNGMKTVQTLYQEWNNGTGSPFRTAAAQDVINAAETAARKSADTTLQNNINSEAATRASADTAINAKIPNQASASNQLADKAFVNSSIEQMAARPLTYNAAGSPFPSKAALLAATAFYYKGGTANPSDNDYVVVQTDETQNNGQVRYGYAGTYPNGNWVFRYKINDAPFTAAQWNAINSGATEGLIANSASQAYVAGKVGEHNVNDTAHNDIRQAFAAADQNLQSQINTLVPEGLENLPEIIAAKLSKVSRDASLTGDGTASSPLGVNFPPENVSRTDKQKYPTPNMATVAATAYNLDTYRTVGEYSLYSPNSSSTNFPSDYGTFDSSNSAILKVYSFNTTTTYICQILYQRASPYNVWRRYSTSATAWTVWEKISLPVLNNNTAPISAKKYALCYEYKSESTAYDLNSYIGYGEYTLYSPASTSINFPSGWGTGTANAAFLKVLPFYITATTAAVRQELYKRGTNEMWSRYSTSATAWTTWVKMLPASGKKYATLVIGNTGAGHTADRVDYLCTGTNDHTVINSAIAALPANGGKIVILEGTYNIGGYINLNKDNVWLQGMGRSTVLNGTVSLSTGILYVPGSYCKIDSLEFTNNSGIVVNHSIFVSGIHNTITNNVIGNNSGIGTSYGIYVGANARVTTITDNFCDNKSDYSGGNTFGIYILSSNNTITGNICSNYSYESSYGIYIYNGSNNTITGNTCSNTGGGHVAGIYIYNGSNNTITGNTCSNYGYTAQGYSCGIYIYGSNNTITGNTLKNYKEYNQSTSNTWSFYIDLACKYLIITSNNLRGVTGNGGGTYSQNLTSTGSTWAGLTTAAWGVQLASGSAISPYSIAGGNII